MNHDKRTQLDPVLQLFIQTVRDAGIPKKMTINALNISAKVINEIFIYPRIYADKNVRKIYTTIKESPSLTLYDLLFPNLPKSLFKFRNELIKYSGKLFICIDEYIIENPVSTHKKSKQIKKKTKKDNPFYLKHSDHVIKSELIEV